LYFVISFISCGDYVSSTSALSKRTSIRCKSLAVILAKQTGNTELYITLATECIYSCIKEEQYNEAIELIEQIPDLKVINLFIIYIISNNIMYSY